MTRRAAAAFALAVTACGGGSPRQPLYAAGDDKDDGHGLLARASSRLLTDNESVPDPFAPQRSRIDAAYGGSIYGGDAYGMYGGDAYGGAAYAAYTPAPWGYPSVNRMPTYTQKAGLESAIEGTITWRGAMPAVTTRCGTIEPLRVSSARTVGGVLVYIERVNIGRTLPHGTGEQQPSTVGGVVVKRGCALTPAVQIVTPVPAALSIHGDTQRARIKISGPAANATMTAELQEAGRVVVQAKAGVTRIEGEDGGLGAAWIVGSDSPYYAITSDDGRFRIDELAPGTYEVTIWQPPIPTAVNGTLAYGPPVLVRRTVSVATGRPTRLDVALGK